MVTKRIGRKWLLWMGGLIVISAMVFVLTTDSPAQAKKDAKGKTDTKKGKKDNKPDPEAKKEKLVAPTNFPPRKDNIDASTPGAQHISLIDDLIKKGWKENNTFPSERCTDYEFIRRASLDIIGRIPTVAEIRRFMSKSESTRRSWLINAMLDGTEYGNGSEYSQNFANLWTVNLMTRSGSSKMHQAQMSSWLADQFKGEDSSNPPDWSKAAFQLIAATGKTNEKQAVNYLLHNMGEMINQAQDKNGKWDMIPATSRTTRLFLGIRTQCVQCHDHPFNGEWRQEHFWGINAFLRQMDTSPGGRPNPALAGKKKKGFEQQYTVTDNKGFNTSALVFYERRNQVVLPTDPSFLDGKKIPKKFTGTRREALAQFVTTSPYFAKAFVNRTWNHFFGKSFTRDSVDDFHEQNQISHPELLDKLAADWAKDYKHNPKVLIRWICNSQAYGLSSKANKYNDQTDHEVLFTRILLKPMSPEQMFESMMVATDSKLRGDKNKEARLALREKWLDRLVVNFGNDEGEEGSFSGTVVQALLLMNGQDINNAITDKKDGFVSAMISRHGGASYQKLPLAVREMYLATVNREPTKVEMDDYRSARFFAFRPGSKTTPTTQEFWRAYYEDIMWALLNSNEFILNH